MYAQRTLLPYVEDRLRIFALTYFGRNWLDSLKNLQGCAMIWLS